MSFSEHSIDLPCVGETSLHRFSYLTWGNPSSPPVMCVHGLTRNAHDFDFLAERLSKHFHVICPDIVGRGNSGRLSNPLSYNYTTYIGDCMALLAHLGIPRLRWVGTSMGGILGMIACAMNPVLVEKLVLNDVGAMIPQAGLMRLKSYVGLKTSFATRKEAENHLRGVMLPFGIKNHMEWLHLFRYSIEESGNGTFRLAYDPAIAYVFSDGAAIVDLDLSPLWNAVQVSTLILRGRESDILSESTAQEMVNSRSNVSLIEYPGIGHAPSLLEEKQIDDVERFLLA